MRTPTEKVNEIYKMQIIKFPGVKRIFTNQYIDYILTVSIIYASGWGI